MAQNHILLETINLTQSASSVTFDNIPQTGYTDLRLVISSRVSSTDSPVLVNFSGVSTGYSWRRIYGNGTAASALSGSDGYFLHANTSSTTANTFSNTEMDIANYRVAQPKHISVDTVLENNATAGELFMLAALWNNNTAITSIVLTPLNGSFVARSSFSLYGIAELGTTPVTAPFATGGNIVANDGTYWYHAFTSSGTFTPTKALTCDYVVIAGGGSGGAHNSGGGGGGGVRSTITATGGGGTLESPLSLIAQNYAVTIGAGGTGVTDTVGVNGNNSIFATVTSTGGGGGGSQTTGTVGSGGSGGGGSINAAGGTRTASPVQGFNGGTGVGGSNSGAGGGGAGQVGSAAGGGGGAGGNGVQITTTGLFGASYYWAGGGGGSAYSAGGGAGGLGGAGGGHSSAGNGGSAGGSGFSAGSAGSGSFNGDGGSAGSNTGSGGGGANRQSGTSGAGGSGIVIVRYAMV